MNNFLEKLKKNRTKKMSDKKLLLISVCISLVIILLILLFVFRDNIKIGIGGNWRGEDEYGDIATNDSAVEEFPTIETFTDNLGITYERRNIISLGMSVYVPQNWSINIDTPDIVYLTTKEKKFNTIQVALTSRRYPQQNTTELSSNMASYIRENFKYHIHSYELNSKTYNADSSTYMIVGDPKTKVWVEKNAPIRKEYTEIPNGKSNGWISEDKFLYAWESGSMKMSSDYGDLKAEPYYSFFYTYAGDIEYMVSVVAPKDFSSQCDSIGKTIISSLTTLSDVKVITPSFSKAYNIGSLNFKLPKNFKKLISGQQYFNAISSDFSYNDLGIGVVACKETFGAESDAKEVSLTAGTEYAAKLFTAYSAGTAQNALSTTMKDMILEHTEKDKITLGGKDAQRVDLSMYLLTANTDAALNNRSPLPINAIAYLIRDGKSVYTIAVTYSKGAESIAESYAHALSKTIRFS